MLHSMLRLQPAGIARLATLLQVAEGAWALAVYENERRRRMFTRQLRAAIRPLPLIEISLRGITPDPLHIVQRHPSGALASVVSFTDVGSALPELYSYLDFEREALAQLPQRLLFWLYVDELHDFACHAPNFYSRVSGVFQLELPAHMGLQRSHVPITP